MASVYDGASRLTSNVKQTLPHPSLPSCVLQEERAARKGRKSFGGDLNTFIGLSLTASVLPVHRPQGCSPL